MIFCFKITERSQKLFSQSTSFITTEGSAKLTMTHCSVYVNLPNSNVFWNTSGSITCDNCSIGSDQKGSFSTPSATFINQYSFLNLGECQGTIEIWKTPKQTPQETPQETPKQTPQETPEQTVSILEKLFKFKSRQFYLCVM